MNYLNVYNNLINKVKSEGRIKSGGLYYECHHIIPKCLGGNNLKDNLVLLTAREHFIAHKLLAKINCRATLLPPLFLSTNEISVCRWFLSSPNKLI